MKNDEKPRISVIMGIYNCAATLNEALDSLLSQTYQAFKVIMCDDGSTDETAAVAQQYVLSYPDKFTLISNPVNVGLNHTLNRCLELVDTEYVARMDGDDISLPLRFEKEIRFLDMHPEYAIVDCQSIMFDEDGDYARGISFGEVSKADFVKGTPFHHPACMVRTAVYRALGGYGEAKSLLRVEDYHLWVKLYAAGYRGYNMPDVLFRKREDSNVIARRTFQNRINEFRVRNYAASALKLPFCARLYSIRPLVLAVLPMSVYRYLRKQKIIHTRFLNG